MHKSTKNTRRYKKAKAALQTFFFFFFFKLPYGLRTRPKLILRRQNRHRRHGNTRRGHAHDFPNHDGSLLARLVWSGRRRGKVQRHVIGRPVSLVGAFDFVLTGVKVGRVKGERAGEKSSIRHVKIFHLLLYIILLSWLYVQQYKMFVQVGGNANGFIHQRTQRCCTPQRRATTIMRHAAFPGALLNEGLYRSKAYQYYIRNTSK